MTTIKIEYAGPMTREEIEFALDVEYGPATPRRREPWQDAGPCPWTHSGICLGKSAAACVCARGMYPSRVYVESFARVKAEAIRKRHEDKS